ncbi:MAG: 4-hydroxythreonine-4-phosphate dehydrogenase PdxA [Betaproteobacteria bacterium]|nr:4-hydroxythreonine-4-phosphate dehydrogenase PdxA [Betaproteobacteria bacterium]
MIALTTGEPAGVGPELCLAIASRPQRARLVLLGDRDMLAARAAQCAWTLPPLPDYQPGTDAPVSLANIRTAVPGVAGQLDARNARYVIALLDRARQGCQSGEFAAMVTAPVHKGVINDGGIPFSGHTEYLQAATGAPHVVMLLAGTVDGRALRVALATTHLPLSAVPNAITATLLFDTLRVLDADLQKRFGIARPRIFASGLNPHAGEGGHLGREEIEIIAPALAKARAAGIDVVGPLPADTLFSPDNLAAADAFLVMYHDQGLPVLKYATFGEGVNITLGLPFIRTSVDHGTALDLASTGKAHAGSLQAALDLAIDLATLNR